MKEKILKFILKILFILKAASDGWIVTYIGGDKYEFSGKSKKLNINNFIKKYNPYLI